MEPVCGKARSQRQALVSWYLGWPPGERQIFMECLLELVQVLKTSYILGMGTPPGQLGESG